MGIGGQRPSPVRGMGRGTGREQDWSQVQNTKLRKMVIGIG